MSILKTISEYERKLDLKAILAIATILLGSNVGSNTLWTRLVSAPEIEKYQTSTNQLAEMFKSVLERSNARWNTCNDNLLACYRKCGD